MPRQRCSCQSLQKDATDINGILEYFWSELVLTRNIKDGLTICSQSDDSERRDKVNIHTFDLLKPQTAPFYLRFCCTKECATFICKENVFKKLSTNINSKSVAHAAKSKRTKSAAA